MEDCFRSHAPRIALVALALTLVATLGADVFAAGQSSVDGVRVDETTSATIAFGVFTPSDSGGEMVFTPTSSVGLAPGVNYGWRMQVRTVRPTVTYTERVRLPAATSWGVGPDTTVSADRTSAVTTSTVPVPSNGVIDHVWTMVEEDPRGVYAFDVSLNSVRVGSANIMVQ